VDTASEIDRLKTRASELSDLSNHLQAFSENEKANLARLLHDELGGLLTAAKMDLSWLQSRITDAVLVERLGQLGAVLDEAMNLKRRVVEDLRPSLLDHFGLPTAARAYVESTCTKQGLKSVVNGESSCDLLTRDSSIAMFRALQEGLANTIRHSGASQVNLSFGGTPSLCVVTLADDGRGFDTAGADFQWGFGIAVVRNRMQALGGRLEVESQPGKGTRLLIEAPMQHGPAESSFRGVAA
jgi:signal transduction histidine kinase